MTYLANLPRGLGAGVFTLALLLGVLGPAVSPAQAAGSRPATPAEVTPGTADPVSSANSVAAGSSASPGLTGQTAAKGRKLQLSLVNVAPTTLTYEDDLQVTAILRNPGKRAAKNVDVDLRFSFSALSGRDAVTDWVEDGDIATTSATLASYRVKNVAAGGSATFTITVPSGGMGLTTSGSSFGPRPFALVATSAQGRPLDSLRSTLVWAPQDVDQKLGLTLLAPLTSATPSTTAGLPTEEAAAELLPDSRLSRILNASRDPAIGWAIDPALLAAAKALDDGGITEDTEAVVEPTDDAGEPSSDAPSPTSTDDADNEFGITDEAASNAGSTWLSRITAGRAKRSVFALPYADTDVNSTLKGGTSSDLLRQSEQLGASVSKETLGKALPTRIAWPADGTISALAVDGLAKTNHTWAVLAAGQQRPDPAIDYTPNGTSTVRSKNGTLTGLLYDEDLSALFAGSGQDPSAETTQTMLATLAAISAETTPDGAGDRQVLAVAPRDWDPQPTGVQRLTTALRQASWVQLGSVKKLGASTAVDRENHRYTRKAAQSQLPKGNLSNVQAMDRDLDSVAPGLIDNQDRVRRLEQRIASLLSFAWRSDAEEQAIARRSVMDDVDDLAGGVQLLIGSKSKTFTARSAPITVTVDNQTPYAWRGVVQFTSGSGQLKIDRQPEPVTISAEHRQSFRVEARAIATGDVNVEVRLLSGEGAGQEVLGSPQTFEVKVRPNWESWGMIGMGTILGVLLLIGLLRSFRRNRTRPKVPLDTIPDLDDEAARAARQAAREAAALRAASTQPIPRIGDRPPGASSRASGGGSAGTQPGSNTGGDQPHTPGTGSASGTPGDSRGIHDQKSSSVPTMAATKGAERRSPTLPKENR